MTKLTRISYSNDPTLGVQVGPVFVRRCTEAVDPRTGYGFSTFGNPEGRCIEIAAGSNRMLFDRRLAHRIATEILAICGPDEPLESDAEQADILEVVYNERGVPVGFQPYGGGPQEVPPEPPLTKAHRYWVEKVRADKGLPPSSLFDGAGHG